MPARISIALRVLVIFKEGELLSLDAAEMELADENAARNTLERARNVRSLRVGGARGYLPGRAERGCAAKTITSSAV